MNANNLQNKLQQKVTTTVQRSHPRTGIRCSVVFRAKMVKCLYFAVFLRFALLRG